MKVKSSTTPIPPPPRKEPVARSPALLLSPWGQTGGRKIPSILSSESVRTAKKEKTQNKTPKILQWGNHQGPQKAHSRKHPPSPPRIKNPRAEKYWRTPSPLGQVGERDEPEYSHRAPVSPEVMDTARRCRYKSAPCKKGIMFTVGLAPWGPAAASPHKLSWAYSRAWAGKPQPRSPSMG